MFDVRHLTCKDSYTQKRDKYFVYLLRKRCRLESYVGHSSSGQRIRGHKNLSTLGGEFFHAILQDGLTATEVLKSEREWQFTYKSRLVNKNVAGRKKFEYNNERWVVCQGCLGRFKYASGRMHYKRCINMQKDQIIKQKEEIILNLQKKRKRKHQYNK